MKRWQAGKKTQVIDDWPELQPGLQIYMDAFIELCTDRPPAIEAIRSIPFGSIAHYADKYGFHGEDFEDLRYFVRILDNTYIEHYSKKVGQTGKDRVNF